MKTILRAALLAVTFLSAGAANADTLTLEEAIRQSVANSPLGAAATARVEVLEAARAAWKGDATKRYLQVSTDEVYGTLGEEGEFTLSTPLAPNSPYASSKAAADLLVRAWHRTYGMNTVITRCCNNVAHSGWADHCEQQHTRGRY